MTGAERTRRYRERKASGVLVSVFLPDSTVEALERRGVIGEDEFTLAPASAAEKLVKFVRKQAFGGDASLPGD